MWLTVAVMLGSTIIGRADLINIQTDTPSTFAGTFSFTQGNTSIEKFTALFSHFSADGGGDFNNAFQVRDLAGGFQLKGIGDGKDYGPESYVAAVGGFSDRVSIFTSVDGFTQLKYEYRNVTFNVSGVLSGDFNFAVVPEPMSISLITMAGVGILFWKHRYGSKHADIVSSER